MDLLCFLLQYKNLKKRLGAEYVSVSSGNSAVVLLFFGAYFILSFIDTWSNE